MTTSSHHIETLENKRRARLLEHLPVPGLTNYVLEYAYELQGHCVFAINQPSITWKVVLCPQNRLATASHDTGICVWDFATGEHLFTLTLHTDYVYDLVAWDDKLVSASRDGTARVWDPDQGACLCILEHPAFVTAVAVFEGKLVTACADGLLRLWDGLACAETFAFVDGRFRSLTESDGASVHSRVIILELTVVHQTLVVDTPLQTFIFSPRNVLSAAFDRPDCTRAATIARLGTEAFVTHTQHCVHVWQAELTFSIPCVQIRTLCVLHDGRVAVSCVDGRIRIFTILTGHCHIIDAGAVSDGSHEGINNLVELPDGRLAGSVGAELIVWDLSTGECLVWKRHRCTITDLAVMGVPPRLVITSDSPCEDCECEITPDCDNCGRLCVLA